LFSLEIRNVIFVKFEFLAKMRNGSGIRLKLDYWLDLIIAGQQEPLLTAMQKTHLSN